MECGFSCARNDVGAGDGAESSAWSAMRMVRMLLRGYSPEVSVRGADPGVRCLERGEFWVMGLRTAETPYPEDVTRAV